MKTNNTINTNNTMNTKTTRSTNPLRALFLLAGALASLLLIPACATHIRSNVQVNPPPGEAFVNFTSFEMTPITLAPAYAEQGPNKKALIKIQENLSAGMNPTLAAWNATGASKPGPRRTLLIVPVVTEIKFVGGAARFWVGAMAGSSAVIMNLTITEKETGKIIATPEFYDVGRAMSGGASIGGTDNLMLVNIANKVTQYLLQNYGTATATMAMATATTMAVTPNAAPAPATMNGTGIFALDYPVENWGPKTCSLDMEDGRTSAQVSQAIMETLKAYHWNIESYNDGLIIAGYQRGSEKYPAYIKYDNRHIDIYVNAGRNSNGWAANLRKTMAKKLNVAAK